MEHRTKADLEGDHGDGDVDGDGGLDPRSKYNSNFIAVSKPSLFVQAQHFYACVHQCVRLLVLAFLVRSPACQAVAVLAGLVRRRSIV